jgi:hypothetical protein
MKHEREFSQPPRTERADQAGRDLANCYARVFLGSEDGKRVLADLRTKFGLHRLVFHRASGERFDPIGAALTDGERRVLSEIESALEVGAPNQALNHKPKPQK